MNELGCLVLFIVGILITWMLISYFELMTVKEFAIAFIAGMFVTLLWHRKNEE